MIKVRLDMLAFWSLWRWLLRLLLWCWIFWVMCIFRVLMIAVVLFGWILSTPLFWFCCRLCSVWTLISRIVCWLRLWWECMSLIYHLFVNFHMEEMHVVIKILRFAKDHGWVTSSGYHYIHFLLHFDHVWVNYGRIGKGKNIGKYWSSCGFGSDANGKGKRRWLGDIQSSALSASGAKWVNLS